MEYKVGIRREDINRWERRVPLVPEDAKELGRSHSIRFTIQPSQIRIFSDEEYRAAGINVAEELCPNRVVLALKEIPVQLIQPGKAYVFFSHTGKGQAQNMPMLKKMMDAGCTLIDYEDIVDDKGRRLLYFGNFAGHAGTVDTMWALGRRLEIEGYKDNPFRGLKKAYEYNGLGELKEAVKKVGAAIKADGIPEAVRPIVFGFFGYGHVSQGAQEIFDLLPVEEVRPGDLPRLNESGRDFSRILFKAVFKEEDMVEPITPDAPFVLQDYYSHPEKYRSIVKKSVPYLTAIINGIFWTPNFPKYITKEFLREYYSRSGARLKVIGDITCDINGSIESTVEATDSENPVYVYDPAADRAVSGVTGNGPVVMAVYNLPAELPAESSRYFSSGLKKYVPEIAAMDLTRDFDDCGLSEVIKRATIVYRGGLTPHFEYLKRYLA